MGVPFFRLYQLGKVCLQHGLDDLIPKHKIPAPVRWFRHCLWWLRNQHKDCSQAERLRMALEAMGPVYVKFGQMLSTRRDLLPPDFADSLTLLQDKVSPFPGEQAMATVERALGKPIDELFESFDPKPLASASIAQVHTARLKPSADHPVRDVVVKVTRPGIRKVIRADIELMRMFARLVARFVPDGKRLRPVEVIEEYRRTIFDELDLLREAANGIQLRRNFAQDPALYVPLIYADYCRQEMLVMERIYGVPVSDVEYLREHNVNLKLLAERGVQVFFTQVFRDSFFHADMHPGNVFIDATDPEHPSYIGIDYGIVGTLNREDKRYLAENFIAFFNRDYRKVAELHVESGWVPADTNIEEFESAIRTVCEPIFQKPLADISFGHVLLNLFNTARRFNMEVQPQLVLLQKTLLYIEGLGRQLYPQLDLWQTAKPFLENWMKEQIGPKAVWKQVRANLPFWSEKFPEIPDLVYESMRSMQQLPAMQAKWLQRQQALQVKIHSSRVWLGTGLIVLAAGLFFQPHYGVGSVVVGIVVGIGCILRSSRVLKKPYDD